MKKILEGFCGCVEVFCGLLRLDIRKEWIGRRGVIDDDEEI